MSATQAELLLTPKLEMSQITIFVFFVIFFAGHSFQSVFVVWRWVQQLMLWISGRGTVTSEEQLAIYNESPYIPRILRKRMHLTPYLLKRKDNSTDEQWAALVWSFLKFESWKLEIRKFGFQFLKPVLWGKESEQKHLGLPRAAGLRCHWAAALSQHFLELSVLSSKNLCFHNSNCWFIHCSQQWGWWKGSCLGCKTRPFRAGLVAESPVLTSTQNTPFPNRFSNFKNINFQLGWLDLRFWSIQRTKRRTKPANHVFLLHKTYFFLLSVLDQGRVSKEIWPTRFRLFKIVTPWSQIVTPWR